MPEMMISMLEELKRVQGSFRARKTGLSRI